MWNIFYRLSEKIKTLLLCNSLSDDDCLTGSMLFAMKTAKEKPDYKKYAEEYLNLQ